jgi:amino acid adenylation domain-containing protein
MTQEVSIPRAWIDGAQCPVPERTVHESFLINARHDPDATAVRQWDMRLTYRQLANASAGLARRLRSAGAVPGCRVGICMRRIPWLPASALAALMAGCTFVPLDPDQPRQRLQVVAQDAGIRFAFVDDTGAALLSGVVENLVTAGFRNSREFDDVDWPGDSGSAQLDTPAYIMYTSGSTGRPKGVIVSHRNLTSFVCSANQYLGGSPDFRLAAFAAIGYDVSVYDFFTTLVSGGCLQLVSEAERADAGRLQTFLEAHQTTRACLPPVVLPLLDPERLPSLRELIVGGEACDPRQVERWAVRGQRSFHNWYGPTEATVAVLGIELNGAWDRPLPLGRPLPGCSVYVLDPDMKICSPGQAGELFIGGPQVALGYTNAPAESAERFIPDPLNALGSLHDPSSAGGGGGVLYRTGDLALWDEKGLVSFLGRADRQVKIHGQRVEPGEVETVLSGHPRVIHAIVDISGSAVQAYVTPSDAPSSDELRAYCAARLPRHMVPVSVTAVARVPLTVNAKVDYAALRELKPASRPGRPSAAESAAQPLRTEFERAVAEAWRTIFGFACSDLDDDFFAAGGDSLTAMRFASALRVSTDRDVRAQDIFTGRTVGGIAERVGSAEVDAGATHPTGSAPDLSLAQRRLWFVEQFAPGEPMHNIVLAEHITGALDVGALERAFEHVVRHQTALRWRLRAGDGLPGVFLSEPEAITFPVHDLSGLDHEARDAAVARTLRDEARTPISLTDGHLWRVRLLRLAEEEHAFVFTLHHIIFDGWSQAVLYRDLGEAYSHEVAGIPEDGSAPTSTTFADYASWTLRQARLKGPTDTVWWKQHLSGAPTVLDLPRDHARPAMASFNGTRCTADIDENLAADVRELATAQGTTAGAVLLSAFSVLLRRLTGQRDQVVGSPLADRGHPDFENLVGFFVRTLPLRLHVNDHDTFTEHIQRCTDELGSARQHADAPLERIVEQLGGHRDLTRNPLFQVMFNVYNFAEAHLELGEAVVHPLQVGVPASLVDLAFYVIPRENGIRLEVVYNRDLYDSQRIDALLASYAYLLAELVRHPGRGVGVACARPEGTRLPDWTVPLTSDVPDTPGLLELVRAVGCAEPDAKATRDADGALSYGDVLRVVDATAAALREAGVRTGEPVAVLARRTAILPAVLLGVLSAGARWAVMDHDLPSAVLGRRLAAVRPRAVVSWGRDNAVPADVTVPVLDASSFVSPAIVPLSVIDADAAERGYYSFTSGTTGEAQLVDTAEAPLVHFLNWYRHAFGLERGARFALLSALAHDPVLRDMFTPLVCGGTLLVPAEKLLRDPIGLLDWLRDNDVTIVHATPQLVRMLAAGREFGRPLQSLRLVAVAGDQLMRDDVAVLRRLAPHARVLNFYGTTETPQAQAYFEVAAQAETLDPHASLAEGTMPVPVGAGIDGAQLIVMSVSGSPAAVGELGEVIIRGRHLSNRYLDKALSDQRYAPLPDAGTERAFRTGDLGRYGPSGAVTLAGRSDDQVKVRGFRVELGEVEAAIRSHPDVDDAAVRSFDYHGVTVVHGYVVGPPGIAESDVLRRARAGLPSYAVPSGITLVSALPRNAAGKVDRSLLPVPRQPAYDVTDGDEAPKGDLERLITAIWCEVLGRSPVNRGDNFFNVGGHSMAIVEVQSRLKRALDRQIPIADLFRFPTVRDLAGHLATQRPTISSSDGDLRGRIRRQRAHRPGRYKSRGDGSR